LICLNFFQKKRQKVLDKGLPLCYSIQARLRETAGKSEANLENDTEEIERAIRKKDSEDSKELSIER